MWCAVAILAHCSSNTCSKCLNISIYLCQTVCVMGVRSLSLPAFQQCLFHPNQLSGCRVIHVFVSVQTLVQSVQTFQYICAGLFALCVSNPPHFQLSNGASVIQIGWVVAELFMSLGYMVLWTCKGGISGSKACNHYSLCIPTAIYTGNTILSRFVHLPCHPFVMHFVSVQTVCHCLETVWTLVQSVQTFQYICARLFALCVSGLPWCQLSNGASAVQISGLVAELCMFLNYIVLWTCKCGISTSKACNHYSFCITTAIYIGNTVLSLLAHLPCHPFTMQYVSPSCLLLFGNCSNT